MKIASFALALATAGVISAAPAAQAATAGQAAFIDTLYNVVLDRAPDAAGKAFYIAQLDAQGTCSQAQAVALARSFFSSPEFMGKFLSTTSQVNKMYLSLLNRSPDFAGLTFWATQPGAVWGVAPSMWSYPANVSADIAGAIASSQEFMSLRLPAFCS